MRYIGLVFFVFSTAIVYSQDYSNLIENRKYSKVLKKSLKVLKKTPNSIEDLYFASVVTSRVLAGKEYAPKQAYDYYIKAKAEYVKEIDDEKLLKLDKIPINYTSFRILSDSIYTGGLSNAINTNTEEGFIEFLSYFNEATETYKNRAVIERNRLAFENSKTINTVSSFQNFIDKYPDANEVPQAIKERNKLAYRIAQEINTIEGYRDFIKNYANATEVAEAWKGIHALSFKESLAKNTIEGYEEFISKFPSAIQVQEASEKIHSLSYELALKENNSAAFKSFMDKYPTSKQVTKAKEFFYLLEFKENTVQGAWESYRDFYENFEGPYKEIAIDSIYFMAIKGNYQALEFILKNNHKYPKRNDLISSYFNVIKNRGEYSEIYKFYTEFNEIIESNILTEIDSLLVISKEVGELKLDLPYDIKNRGRYLDFIKRSGDIDINFVILQRIISIDISQKNYANALKTIKSLEHLFIKNSNQIESLKKIIEESYDNAIKPISLKEINTNGNEYSPVITADNRSLYFCGRDREFDNKYEKIYCSNLIEDIWATPSVIETNFLINENNAPLASSSDGNTLYIFSEGQIYESNNTESGWSNLELLNNQINTNSWEGDLTVTSDNNTLIFARGNALSEKNIDIVFLVDASGSMQPCISGIQENIYNFINGIQKGDEIVNWRAKVIYYRDFQVDGSDSYINNSFTTNIVELQTQLNHSATGGGDEPESTFESIYKAIKETNWNNNEGTAHVIINFTDATNKDITSPQSFKKFGEIDSDKILNSLKNSNIKLIFFGQNDYQYIGLNSDYADVSLFDNAVAELQNADYSLIMNEISQKVSLLSSNTELYHGDRLPKSDLFISHKNKFGIWDKPIRLPNSINTSYTERSPFLHPDMKTLYFSSDGHGGIGKLDVFMTKRLADSCWNCWSEPINLGKEINGPNSDWGYKISTDGKEAYFSKDSKSKSREDIYKINLQAHLRPDIVARIEGELKNSKNQPISATIRWEDLESNKVIGTSKSDPQDGSYFIVLPMGKNYGYFVEDSSYFPMAQNLDLRNTTNAVEVKKDIVAISFTDMINEKIAVPMNNLFFEKLKSNLLIASYPELNRIATILKEKKYKVEISGHTDNVGSESMNQKLSEDRANSVKNFLISKGVNPSFIQSIGFGFSKPKTTNETEEGKAENRRVEIRFISE